MLVEFVLPMFLEHAPCLPRVASNRGIAIFASKELTTEEPLVNEPSVKALKPSEPLKVKLGNRRICLR